MLGSMYCLVTIHSRMKRGKRLPASKLAPFHPAVNSNTFLINSNEKVWAGGKNESKKRL